MRINTAVVVSFLIFVLPLQASADACLQNVREKMAAEAKSFDSLNVALYSQADLTQKVIGPLRKNRLSPGEAREISAQSEDKSKAWYQVSLWGKDRFRSELFRVDRQSCAIEERYVLLGDDFE